MDDYDMLERLLKNSDGCVEFTVPEILDVVCNCFSSFYRSDADAKDTEHGVLE